MISSRSPCLAVATAAESKGMSLRIFSTAGPTYASARAGARLGWLRQPHAITSSAAVQLTFVSIRPDTLNSQFTSAGKIEIYLPWRSATPDAPSGPLVYGHPGTLRHARHLGTVGLLAPAHNVGRGNACGH